MILKDTTQWRRWGSIPQPLDLEALRSDTGETRTHSLSISRHYAVTPVRLEPTTPWSPDKHCGSTKCSPTQYAPFSSILCTLHTQYAPLEHFVYPAYTICYQWSILCRVDTYVFSVVVRGYTICSSWKHVSWYLPFFLTVLSTFICLSYEPYV